MPLTQVEDFVDTRLAQKISQLPGVGLVSLSAAASGPRCASRPTSASSRPTASTSTICAPRFGNANVNTPKGNFDGAMRAYTINANDQIRNAADYKSLIVAYKNGSPVRLSDVGDVVDGAAERQARRLDERDPGDHPEHPAPARRQRHRGGRGHQVAAAAAAGLAALRDRPQHPDRPHHHHPRLGARRRIRIVARRAAGGAGDLRVPAQRPRHADPEPVGAAVAGRHARRDVPVRLQPQQSVADGADDRDRLRGRRRHRRDREHLALHRGRRDAAAGRASRAPNRSASPSSR